MRPNMKPRITEQADTGREGFRYSWLLDGIRFQGKHAFTGWKWIAGVGCRGCYCTDQATLALAMACRLRIDIGTNGSHIAIKAPPSSVWQASRGLDQDGLDVQVGIE